MKRGEKRMLNGFGNSRRRLLFLVLAGLLMAMSQDALWEAIAADPTPESLVNCSIQQGPCTKDLGGMTVTLDILPKPVMAMKDLKFQVILSGEKLTTNPYVDPGIPGMNMGLNLYGSNSPQLAAALSFPRRRESRLGHFFWTPAFAGVTVVTIAHIPLACSGGVQS